MSAEATVALLKGMIAATDFAPPEPRLWSLMLHAITTCDLVQGAQRKPCGCGGAQRG